jgi:hypothetical protein
MTFALVVAWDVGFVNLALESDRSGISLAIAVVFAAASLHAAYRAWVLSRELGAAARLVADAAHGEVARVRGADRETHGPSDGLAARHLRRLRRSGQGDRVVLLEALREHARGSHDVGWMIADSMFKLGILGTVVGFILMLGSVAESDSLDLASLQSVLLAMSDGMRVALYTTLTGLIAGMLLGFQYLLVDRAADRLVSLVIELGSDDSNAMEETSDRA